MEDLITTLFFALAGFSIGMSVGYARQVNNFKVVIEEMEQESLEREQALFELLDEYPIILEESSNEL
jgi:hypothetical protein